MAHTPFTLLMPVYRGDSADFFRLAIQSATTEQTLPPDRVIIVRDGPVNEDIEAILTELSHNPTVTILRLLSNQGLASALNAGLSKVTTEVVARADADDFCMPQRFATQLPVIEAGADIVGGSIQEFESDPDKPGRVRLAETDPVRIRQRARFECPFFHPTVMYRVSAVRQAGGYPHLSQLEDYLLWAAMIQDGASVANCPEILVRFRVGAGSYTRRGGWRILHSEWKLQRELRNMA